MARKIFLTGIGTFLVTLFLFPVLAIASTLHWDAVSGDVTGYRVYYGMTSGSYSANVDAGLSTEYDISSLSLTEGATYYFIVRAYNSIGESDNSNEVSWTVPDTTAPFPPTGVACQSGSVDLQWQANTESDLAGYRVYVGTSTGSYSPFVPVGTATNYTVPTPVEGTTYYLAVTAVDDDGNESSYSAEVSSTYQPAVPADTVSPSLTINSPTTASNYSTDQASVSLAGTASDNVGVTQVTWSNSRGGSGSAVGTTSWSIANVTLYSGVNTLIVKAVDADGNEGGRILTVTYTAPDTEAPVLNVTEPTAGTTYATNSSVMGMAGTASDNVGVTQVSWTNSRGGSGTASGTTSWTVSNIPLAEGQNLITVTAVDDVGNSSQKTLTVTYTIPDTTSPTVNISSPTTAETYATSTGTVTLSGSAADSDSVAEVSWVNSRGDGDVASGTTSWTAAGISLAEGENVITVTAEDASGNQASDVLVVTYTPVDTISPMVVIAQPTTSGSYATESGTINLSGSASDNYGVTQVTWNNAQGGGGTASGTTSWSASGVTLAEGQNMITVTARDSAGNTGSATLLVTYTEPDTTNPQVSITSPTSAGSYTVTDGASIDLAGTASDNIGVEQVSWANTRGGSGTASGTTSWSASGIRLYEGQNIVTVTAEDAAGNTSSSILTVTFSPEDTTAPTIIRSKPTSAPYYFTRRTTMNLEGTATDNEGVTEVTWSLGDQSGVASGTTDWKVTGITLTRGWNTIEITAKDAAGNEETDTFYVICWYF